MLLLQDIKYDDTFCMNTVIQKFVWLSFKIGVAHERIYLAFYSFLLHLFVVSQKAKN